MTTLAQRCRQIELLVLDVDGVLTPGSIVYPDAQSETKHFHVRDGTGLRVWHARGRRSAVITGRQSPVVERRCRELGVTFVLQGVVDKRAALATLLAEPGLNPEQIATIGDDLQDVEMLGRSGLAIAVADACVEVVLAAHWITRQPGGHAAVREAIERILRCQGRW